MVFTPTPGPVDLRDWRRWWGWLPRSLSGALPRGRARRSRNGWTIRSLQVAFADATAYARWAGKALPTEVEFEYAARGALDAACLAWGQQGRARVVS